MPPSKSFLVGAVLFLFSFSYTMLLISYFCSTAHFFSASKTKKKKREIIKFSNAFAYPSHSHLILENISMTRYLCPYTSDRKRKSPKTRGKPNTLGTIEMYNRVIKHQVKRHTHVDLLCLHLYYETYSRCSYDLSNHWIVILTSLFPSKEQLFCLPERAPYIPDFLLYPLAHTTE